MSSILNSDEGSYKPFRIITSLIDGKNRICYDIVEKFKSETRSLQWNQSSNCVHDTMNKTRNHIYLNEKIYYFTSDTTVYVK